MVRKAGLEPASLSALAPKASVFAISPLPHIGQSAKPTAQTASFALMAQIKSRGKDMQTATPHRAPGSTRLHTSERLSR